MQKITTIHVRLLEEGTIVYRPTPAHAIGGGIFKLLRPADYDAANEHWEHPPGALVRGENRRLDQGEVLVAVGPAESAP